LGYKRFLKRKSNPSTSEIRRRAKAGTLRGSQDFVRIKKDSYVIRQNEIYQKLKHYEGISKDFFKARTWWDFSFHKQRLLIKIIPQTYKVNNATIKLLEAYGWKVLYVRYKDVDGTSFDKLIKDIDFHMSKGDFIKRVSADLNNNLSKSEIWFRDKIKLEPFYNQLDFEFNKPMFGRFIYDLFSAKYRLCVEVDGSVHDLEEVKQKDNIKNNLTISKGFIHQCRT